MKQSTHSPHVRKRLNLIPLAVLVGGIFALPDRLLHAEEEQSSAYSITPQTRNAAPDGISGTCREIVGIGEVLKLEAKGKLLGDVNKIKWTVDSGDEHIVGNKAGKYYALSIKALYQAKDRIVKISFETEYNKKARSNSR